MEAGGGCRALCSAESFTTGTSPRPGHLSIPQAILIAELNCETVKSGTVPSEFSTDYHYLTDRVYLLMANPFLGEKKKVLFP